ncbi:MAG: CpaE family protein, partial [Novosphingobium sp.]
VIDLPRNMLINFPHLMADVNVVLLATEFTLASARDAIRLLSWLKVNAAHAQTIVVANKVQTGTQEISRADFEASIERKVNFTIPFDSKGAANAAKLGQTFAEANRTSKSAAVVRDIANQILGIGDAEEAAADLTKAKGKKSLLGKFDLKTMLAKKEKPKVAQPAA